MLPTNTLIDRYEFTLHNKFMSKLKQSGLAVLSMTLAWVWHHKNGRLYIPAGPGLNAERCHRENSQKEMRAVSGSFACVVRAT